MSERLLRIEAKHFVAGAVWQKNSDVWECVRAAPIINWMIGKPAKDVAAYLVRKGYPFDWRIVDE